MADRETREWLDEEVSISREELATIMREEIYDVVAATATITNDEDFTEFIDGLFRIFAASVSTKIFRKREEEERDR